jgi:hypothetical protein
VGVTLEIDAALTGAGMRAGAAAEGGHPAPPVHLARMADAVGFRLRRCEGICPAIHDEETTPDADARTSGKRP